MGFVHLHNHTDYSLLDGAGSAAKYVKKAKDLGMASLGITDHGNMFGVMEFYFTCKKECIKPVIGCEFYICPEGRNLRDCNCTMLRSYLYKTIYSLLTVFLLANYRKE